MKGIKRKIRDNRYISWVLIISNWVFQSIPNSDKTEKVYKILFILIFWLAAYLMLKYLFVFETLHSVLLGFVFGHTINWIVNGNFYNLIIHRLMLVKLSKNNLFLYIDVLGKKLEYQEWVLYAASFGSICKGTLKDSSDIDVSIVRKPGLRNGLASIWFVIKEKKIADIKGIPLEIYISDSPNNSIKRFGGERNPVVLFDPENAIDKYYQEKLSIQEARKLNNVI
jgi:predicted nucleotidyltransferase